MDITNPTISIVSPLPISKNNSVTPTIIFTLNDTLESGSGVDTSTLQVTINGQYVFHDGNLQANFDGYYIQTPDASNYTVYVTPQVALLPLQSTQVSVSVQDLAHNPASTLVYSFFTLDNLPPSITNISPANNTGRVASNAQISFTVSTTPIQTSVNINSLVTLTSGADSSFTQLSIDGYDIQVAKDAYDNLQYVQVDAYGVASFAVDPNGNSLLPLTVDPTKLETAVIIPYLGSLVYDQRQVSITPTVNGLGYNINVIPLNPLALSAKVILDIYITNIAGHTANSVTSFTTSDDQAPTLLNPFPFPSSNGALLTSAVSFTIAEKQGESFGSGVNLSSVQVSVDNRKAIVDGFALPNSDFIVNIYPNSIVNGYDFYIASTTLYSPHATINVQIIAADYSLNVLSTNYFFTTETTTSPQIVFVSPFPNGATNVPRNTAIIVDVVSDTAVGEIDIPSIIISVNGTPAFIDNSFQLGFSGLAIATTPTTLTITITKNSPFDLGEFVTLTASAASIFNALSSSTTATFTVTSQLVLTSIATPMPGIYDRTQSISGFPSVGTILPVTLTANSPTASIAYTTDGSDPIIGMGTTQIYTSSINISSSSSVGIIRYFAFDLTLNETENPKSAVYIFSNCPEIETWNGTALTEGLLYTINTRLNNAQLVDGYALTELDSTKRVGTATYIHDLGRDCFIDSLNFNTTGIGKFRVRASETSTIDLLSQPWLNSLINFVDNQVVSLQQGIGPQITTNGNNFHIEGRSQLEDIFADEATVTVTSPLLESFTVNATMRLSEDVNNIVGAKSFLRIKDDTYTLEVQQYISKASSVLSSQLINQNALFQEHVRVKVNGVDAYDDGYIHYPLDAYDAYDAYDALTDGYNGYVQLITPPQQMVDTINFITNEVININHLAQLNPNTNGVFGITSSTDSIYNEFTYSDQSDGYTYSSAIVKAVYYKRFVSEIRTSFAIAVTGIALDSTTAIINSENLDPYSDKYIPAEPNGVFSTSVFLEVGDYNFRYSVTSSTGTRLVVNPYNFITSQSLVGVQLNDILVVGSSQYPIASVLRLESNNYAIEFIKNFPNSTQEILSWSIVRGQTTIVTSTARILVTNPSNATLGQDASGQVANIVISTRQSVIFSYPSSTATSVSVVATFNSFNASINPLTQALDSTNIEKIFDTNNDAYYQNSTLNFHKVTVIPELPLIVDRVRFTTAVQADAYQRTRLLLDGHAVTSSKYKAKNADNSPANYLSSVDLYSSAQNGYVEWQYVEVAHNANRIQRKSIELITRLDSLAGISREHMQLEIFTLPTLPQLVGDYYIPIGTDTIYRNNRSGFASAGNDVAVQYATPQNLSQIPTAITSIYEDGLVGNFVKSRITTNLDSYNIYIDNTHLFAVGDNIITYDNISLLRARITNIAADNSGLITLNSVVHSQGIIVKDYKITQDVNNFIAQLEVPNFRIVFTAPIASLSLTANSTILTFQNILETDTSNFLGGRLTYPLLATPATIIDVQPGGQQQVGSSIIQLIVVTIDQVLDATQDQLGAIIEIFNSTKIVDDYVVDKITGQAICLNQSELCSGLGVQVNYSTLLPAYQAPVQMFQVNTNLTTDNIDIIINSAQFNVSLGELNSVTVNFFNGLAAQAPGSVTFTINDAYSISQPLSQALVVDGYMEGTIGSSYNPLYHNTGQIVRFSVPISAFVGIDRTSLLKSLSVQFSGQSSYYIGEIEALVSTDLVNTRCRIVLNDVELFRSSLPVDNTLYNAYQIEIDRGSLLIYFNSALVLIRPILFNNPIFQFGAAGKALDDLVLADFQNLYVDQYFTISPAKLEVIGRYVEIEGTVVS